MPKLKLKDYNYDLPFERIAKFPLSDRAGSRLLVANKKIGILSHHTFKELPELIPENTFLVLNQTKVIRARLRMLKETGGSVELLCVDPLEPSYDPQITLQSKGSCVWKCIAGGKRIGKGSELRIADKKGIFDLKATILEKQGQNAVVELVWKNSLLSFADILEQVGETPLPPYLKRDEIEDDKTNYQTIYAALEGSVAAPTAGLHFTSDVIKRINDRGIDIGEVTLHVGPGTFKPIENENVSEHIMHSELIIVSKVLLRSLKQAIEAHKYIIATGTTSLRTLETLYCAGAKLMRDKKYIEEGYFELGQWEAYDLKEEVSGTDAISELIKYMEDKDIEQLSGRTSLFIVPGYEFKISQGLITNYHMPKSTLILLIAAFIGKDMWQKAYTEALDKGYRFLSYGDSSLLLR